MIIDHCEGFEIDDNMEYMYEAKMALARMSQGLFFISEYVKDKERKHTPTYSIEGIKVDIILNMPYADLLSNMFHWYAITLSNYVLLVGYLQYKNKEDAKQYRKRVIPRVVDFRNKIAAHLAFADPYSRDNLADRLASLYTQLVYAGGYFLAGVLSPVLQEEGEQVEVSRKLDMCVTKNFSEMKKRYWPNGRPDKSNPSIKIRPKDSLKFTIDNEFLDT